MAHPAGPCWRDPDARQHVKDRKTHWPHWEQQSVCWTLGVSFVPAPCVYLQSQSKVAALCVSDEAGCHGTVGPPAPLQIAHGVLVQVARCHQRAARPQTSRRELQAALSCQEAEQGNDAIREEAGTPGGWRAPLILSEQRAAGLLRATYHRGVTLRNTFNPIRGPRMSPAPNSTCRDGRTQDWIKAFRYVTKKVKNLFLQYVDSLERRKFTELLPALTEAAMPHLSPALGWCNPSHSHVYVATSGAVVRRQGTRQHSRVRVCQRSLRKKNF